MHCAQTFSMGVGFFIPFIIITSFAVLNFFIGIIVDSMHTPQKLESKANSLDSNGTITREDLKNLETKLEKISIEIASIKQIKNKPDN